MKRGKYKPMHAWQSLEFTIAQAEEAMKKEGWEILPSNNVLRQHGYSSLCAAIHKYHGGMRKFREILGQNQLQERKEDGYWKNWENVNTELEHIVEEIGHFPTHKELNKLRKSSLINGIHNFGGFRAVREKMGYEQIRKPRGYLQNYDNVVTELKRIMQEHGLEKVPSQIELQRLRYSSIVYAINKYHGGFNRIRTDFGEEIDKIPIGKWKSLEFTIEQAKKAMEKECWKVLPGSYTLYKRGYSNLSTAISIYHGGIRYFREKILGQEQLIEEVGRLKDIDYCIYLAKIIMSNYNFTTFPSSKTLVRIGESSFAAAISKNHGGFPTFRETLRQHMTGKSTKQELEDLLEGYAGDD